MSIARRFVSAVEARWYSRPGLLLLLTPLEYFYRYCVQRQKRLLPAIAVDAPVVVVGNLTVGGVGKTPIVIALVKALRLRGLRPGVVSRGYGRQDQGLERVTPTSTAQQVGDEPLLIHQYTHCPVVVAADRIAAAKALLAQTDCNIIIADDGLQHHRLARDVNVVVVDGSRYFGNGHCLPVGPLREPLDRLSEIHWLVQTGTAATNNTASSLYQSLLARYQLNPIHTTLEPAALRNLATGETVSVAHLARLHPFTAIAGIGRPEKFFSLLRKRLKQQGVADDINTKVFADHHRFVENDFANIATDTIVMTAKDATKCQRFAKPHWWVLDVDVSLPQRLIDSISALVIAHEPINAAPSTLAGSANPHHDRSQDTPTE